MGSNDAADVAWRKVLAVLEMLTVTRPIEAAIVQSQLLIAEGYWSEQPILDAVAARRFSLVALMHPLDGPLGGTRWTPAMRAALRDAYVPAGEQSGFWLYLPKA